MFMVMFKQPFQFTMILKYIVQVFMNTLGVHTWVVMLSHLLVMVKKMVQNTGKFKIHGDHHGEKKVALEL